MTQEQPTPQQSTVQPPGSDIFASSVEPVAMFKSVIVFVLSMRLPPFERFDMGAFDFATTSFFKSPIVIFAGSATLMVMVS